MAFDGHQSTFVNSLFPTNQRQASIYVGGGNDGNDTLPFPPNPSVSPQEQDISFCVPWSYKAHDDPYELISCAQSSVESRKPTGNTDNDGETDLQGLVSNILDEVDSHVSCYSEGSLPTWNPIRSPKTMEKGLLQYMQSEAKVLNTFPFPPNYVSHDALSEAREQRTMDKDVEEFYQQSTGLAANQQCLFNLSNGDRDSYTLRAQKLQLDLPVSFRENMSQMQQSKYDNTSADKDGGKSQPVYNFPDLSDGFRPQSEMSSPCFEPYYEDPSIQSSAQPVSNEQYVPQDINQLVSSFQSFMAGEHDSFCRGDFPNMHKQTFGMPHEDSTAEQWKITSRAASTQSSPAMQTPKQLAGEFGTVQREKNGKVRKPPFKRDAFQDHLLEYLQQPEPFSASVNPSNQYQSKLSMHGESMNRGMNPHSKHHIQQGQMQNKLKPQLQKEKLERMSGFLGEGFSARPLSSAHMRQGDRKQAFSHNPYFDFHRGAQSHRFDGRNGTLSAGNRQQYAPLLCPASDLSGRSSVPVNCNFTPRSVLPNGAAVPAVDVCDMSASEPAAFNSYASDTMARRGESAHHGLASAMMTSMVMNQGGPAIQLFFYLDECYEQWKCLEKERKRTEAVLSKTLVGKRTAAVTNTNLPKTPPNASRVDLLIVQQIREQAKVASLLYGMESVRNIPLHINIQTALNKHYAAICVTQVRRKEETAKMFKHQWHGAHFAEDRDILMVTALKDLTAATRRLRTGLWSVLQATLPKPIKGREQRADKEAACTEGCSCPFEGYSHQV